MAAAAYRPTRLHSTVPQPPRPAPPGHVARFAINGFFGTSPWTNVFWVRNGAAVTPSPAAFASITQQILDRYGETLMSLQSSGSQTTDCSGLYYEPNGEVLGFDASGIHFGQHNEDQMPASMAACLGWRVNQRYKGGHPRTYIGGMHRGAFANPRGLAPAFVSTVISNGNAFHVAVNNLGSGDFNDAHLGTVSFVLRGAWRTPPVFRDFVPGAAHCDQRIDTQRRRLGADPPP